MNGVGVVRQSVPEKAAPCHIRRTPTSQSLTLVSRALGGDHVDEFDDVVVPQLLQNLDLARHGGRQLAVHGEQQLLDGHARLGRAVVAAEHPPVSRWHKTIVPRCGCGGETEKSGHRRTHTYRQPPNAPIGPLPDRLCPLEVGDRPRAPRGAPPSTATTGAHPHHPARRVWLLDSGPLRSLRARLLLGSNVCE